MEKKFDFEKYSKWCEENNLVVESADVLKKYKKHLAEEEEKAKRVAEQKKLFDTICKYKGVEVEYDERAYRFIEKVLEDMLVSIAVTTALYDGAKTIEGIEKTFKKGEDEKYD